MTHSERLQRRGGFVLLIAIAALAVAALQGGRAIGAATASGAKSVDISHFAFHPPTLRVKRGGKVTFANSQNVTHTASSAGFDTKNIAPGTAVTVRFDKKGTFAYHCKIHPFMKGKIVVE
ncbi:MAG TPA: cupredoxin domain-containing protein [Solirubrobacterales bacterium]|nr:cupredoxin domain-containing protein [Solirubrobacterales bacterium]